MPERNPFEDREDRAVNNRAVRMSLLTMSQGIEATQIITEPTSASYIVGLKYTQEDARALQFAIQFETTTDYIVANIASTGQDADENAFTISADDARQLEKIIATVKNELIERLRILKVKLEKEQGERGKEASVSRLLEILNEKIANIPGRIMELELLVAGA